MPGTRPPCPLPDRLPVFPLSGVVLMPFGQLPLNVFEPRYLHMVDDVLGANRLIAMIQPRHTENALVADDAKLYDIGSVGRIVQFNDPGDGRYLITLKGLSRFRVRAVSAPESGRGYRMVTTDYGPFVGDMTDRASTDPHSRERIMDLMRSYFNEQDIAADWEAVDEAPFGALLASLVMSCPFRAPEKQALLQCDSTESRAEMLISLFEMRDSLVPDHGDLKH